MFAMEYSVLGKLHTGFELYNPSKDLFVEEIVAYPNKAYVILSHPIWFDSASLPLRSIPIW